MDWMAKARGICASAKYVGEEIVWTPRADHAGAIAAKSAVLDLNRIVIPGLEFRGEVQFRSYGPYQKYSLMQASSGRRLRVFALEVMPIHKRSHVEPGLELYGSHIQLGDEREFGLSHRARSVKTDLDVGSVTGWIERFQRHSRVYDSEAYPLTPPFVDDLFGTN
ncbi:hypothetical protein [Stenotrophomonas sp. Marseille-Q5258]|uniref:hypothetical protein n=1 Tax=Stenotrophomonas sp. Marseille-Q5258 TaxID=2972779 RepID=UPI0021CA89AE|nr:hypothetical protein [Stenotrophomonas sp. Marseille-Q5258]